MDNELENIDERDQIMDGTDNNSIHEWQRLSPAAIIYFVAGSLKLIFSNVVYLIPVVLFSYDNILQHPYIWLPSLLGLIAVLVLFAFLSFKMYRYRLTDSHVEICSGIFNKAHLNLPFERVQNVKVEQPLYYRITGHACLLLDTAGSFKNEAKIIALKLSFAEKVKAKILSQSKTDTENTAQASVESSTTLAQEATAQLDEVCLNKRQLSDLIIHGITSNRIWILLGGLAPFYNDILESANDSLISLGLDLTALLSTQNHSKLEVVLYALSLTMILMLILVSFSVIGAIISFYGYTLNKQGDRYIRRSGLFTKHEVSMRLSRLQMIVQKQDWLDKLLRRINLKFEQSNSFEQTVNISANSNKILVPSINPEESQLLIDDAYPSNQLKKCISQNTFTAISKRFILRNVGFKIFPLWLLAAGATYYNDKLMLTGVLTAVFILCSALVVLRWKRWGITNDDEFVYLRQGLIGVDYICFPAYKIQQSQFIQNRLMKRHQLASLQFILASGAIKIPMIKESLAYQMIDESLFKVELSKRSWM